MSLILHIDTAITTASVCLSAGEDVIATLVNPSEKDSAAWLHLAIKDILQQNGYRAEDLHAIAVSAGPGSYTGLRVGMATAKGLCYALSLPLISINTLQMMAAAVPDPATTLLCPMIDARRMEVFTSLFTTELETVFPSTNMILDETSFHDQLNSYTISFFGNGSIKAKAVINHHQALFIDHKATAADMVSLAYKRFEAGQFSDLAYAEPFYGKDFHSPISKKNY